MRTRRLVTTLAVGLALWVGVHRVAEAVSSPRATSIAITAWNVTPHAIPANGATQAVVTVAVSDPANVDRVTLDLSAIGGSALAALVDDGVHNDGPASDGVFGLIATVASGTPSSEVSLSVTVNDKQGGQITEFLGTLTVLTPIASARPVDLPAYFGFGSFDGDWMASTSLGWNYQSRFVTWSWQSWGPNYVGDYADSAWDDGFVPIVNVDMLLGAAADCSGLEAKDCAYAHLQNPAIMQGYYDRITAAAQQAAGDQPIIFHLEPDVTAYMQRYSLEHSGQGGMVADDPRTIPAWSGSATYLNTYAGAMQRVVDLIHQHAPNALVALHARMWATGLDVAGQTDPDLDVEGIARRTANFVMWAGGPNLDLVFVDWKDFDAGSGLNVWWDDTNRTLPNFNRVIRWENRVAYYAGRRLMLWKVPAGNMALNNTCGQYQDNRADYAFTHVPDLTEAGVIGLVFGGGADCRTLPSNDGGNILAKATVYYGPPAAPIGVGATVSGGPGAIHLTWSPNTEFDVAGYRLYIGRGAGTLAPYVDLGRRTNQTTVLPMQGHWYLAIAAYDARRVDGLTSPALSVDVAEPYHAYLPAIGR